MQSVGWENFLFDFNFNFNPTQPMKPLPTFFEVTTHAPAPDDALDVVDNGIGDYNSAQKPLADVAPLHVIARDANGKVLGGAVGRTWGRCCELQQLWVEAELRAAGMGSQLMKAFEQEAGQRGCTLIYLETYSFQAPAFYAARGYVQVLRTSGYTGEVVKSVMHKTLAASLETTKA